MRNIGGGGAFRHLGSKYRLNGSTAYLLTSACGCFSPHCVVTTVQRACLTTRSLQLKPIITQDKGDLIVASRQDGGILRRSQQLTEPGATGGDESGPGVGGSAESCSRATQDIASVTVKLAGISCLVATGAHFHTIQRSR